MKSNMEKNTKLAFEMGYKLSLLRTYFSAISDQRISEDRISQTINKELKSLAVYYMALFGNSMIEYPPLQNQGDITRVLTDFYEHIQTSIHVYHSGEVEAAFKLGGLLALSEIAPPVKENVNTVLKRIHEWLIEMGLNPKKLGNVIRKLTSVDDKEREEAREKIAELVLRKKRTSFIVRSLKGLELEIGIPSGVKIVKEW